MLRSGGGLGRGRYEGGGSSVQAEVLGMWAGGVVVRWGGGGYGAGG